MVLAQSASFQRKQLFMVISFPKHLVEIFIFRDYTVSGPKMSNRYRPAERISYKTPHDLAIHPQPESPSSQILGLVAETV
jgi:hypothetical protein